MEYVAAILQSKIGTIQIYNQKSAMNLSGVDAQNDALVGAGVRSQHFHAHHYVLVMGNATETRQAKL